MLRTLSQKWDLDSIFPGGSQSPAFAAFLAALEQDLEAFRQDVAAARAPETAAAAEAWGALIERAQEIFRRLWQAGAFTTCLEAQDVQDEQARVLSGRVRQMGAVYNQALVALDDQIRRIPDPVWQGLLAQERFRPIAFNLEERRRRAAEKLPPEQEALAAALAVDGYHAWGELYNTVVGRITIPYEEDGRTVLLSVGQADNKLRDGNRAVREAVFARYEQAFAETAHLCAAALNHLGGFRLNLYRQRGWDSVLKEPLDLNRMQPATLEAMWGTIEANKDRLVAFLNRKARLLGLERLAWHDVSAPVVAGAGRKMAYEEAAEFIIEQFGRFSPDMAAFARYAFENRWLEVENRPGKRPGGFCTSFPLEGQSRIFMTFAGLATNVSTLAHELGHAYHQHVLRDLPAWAQTYAQNVGETASTFAEMLVADAALRASTDPEERLALLSKRAEDAVSYLMNIHARFIFEVNFYNARRQGPVSVPELNRLMEEAQRQAFRNSLSVYHPYFWASKLHFYITRVPFYNFPYTFGFLFSAGIYARARDEGPGFAGRYVALLRDTGRMQVEDLARRHLGVDLTRPDFWQSALDVVLGYVDEFLRLTA